MTSLFDLTGETAVVIGGTGTLGGAMASALAEAGARVAVVGRSAERGTARVAQIKAAGGQAAYFQADATESDTLAAAHGAIAQRWDDEPSILVNCAGGNRAMAAVPPGGDFAGISLEVWQSMFDINFNAGILLPCQVFGAAMLSSGRSGSIVNIASLAGMTPLSRVPAYSAAKAAVLSLTQFLAREWATRGIRVNAISPGFFPAEQNRRLLVSADGSYTERGNSIIAHTPMARFGDPGEVGGAVIWLASARASSFVTGANIVVDGGFSATTI